MKALLSDSITGPIAGLFIITLITPLLLVLTVLTGLVRVFNKEYPRNLIATKLLSSVVTLSGLAIVSFTSIMMGLKLLWELIFKPSPHHSDDVAIGIAVFKVLIALQVINILYFTYHLIH